LFKLVEDLFCTELSFLVKFLEEDVHGLSSLLGFLVSSEGNLIGCFLFLGFDSSFLFSDTLLFSQFLEVILNEFLIVHFLLTLTIDLLLDLKEDSVALRLVFAFLSDFTSHKESLSKFLAENV
jgi:hypothetical protein